MKSVFTEPFDIRFW